ncbi:MAG: DUF1080 domain-containing protein [Candidatus Hinthialibacter antarcticus]|nr:DUF1080 domain-containing protein [Candidatus Hinthialibacter antarcticus]
MYARFNVTLSLIAFICAFAVSSQSQTWQPLFDGATLNGWTAAENPASFRVEDGAIVCNGPRAHLFYTGDVENADFTNFELRLEWKTETGANSGVFFHTAFQDKGWPAQGYEAQVNNTHRGSGEYIERKKTGSLYSVRNQYLQIANDYEWNTMRIVVRGKRIQMFVNDEKTVDYTEPAQPGRSENREARLLSHGTFALQCHDPESKAYFRRIVVKPLAKPIGGSPTAPLDEIDMQIVQLHNANFPVVDYHVHLKGGLTLQEALENSFRVGINYGIAVNCGLGFPVQDDAGALAFLSQFKHQPAFTAIQAEGREWTTLVSPETVAQFDYVFSDALTWTDHKGRRMRLWMPDEVFVDDEQQFMDMYVDRIVEIISSEPIDIFVNPTFLPEVIAAKYDALWTPARMQRVIDAAVKHGVAIEINARFKIPSAAFIKQAKQSGCTFSFGTNNGDAELGRMEYCLKIVNECKLVAEDMFEPKPDGQKPIQVKGFKK